MTRMKLHVRRCVTSFTAVAALAFAGISPALAVPQIQVQVPAPFAGTAPSGPDGPQVDGANDWNCKPTEAHPRPVVLIHGTGMNATAWTYLAPQLKDLGYCVFALNYGAVPRLLDPNVVVWGAGDITASSKELATFVQRVRDATGAAQVDLVGHSQGGTLARQYLKFDGGANPADPALNVVHSVVTLGATNHGTSFDGLHTLTAQLESWGVPRELLTALWMGPAGAQQLIGSPVLASLNAGSEVQPGIDYTVVATRSDTVSTPPERTFLENDGTAQVNNVWVQDVCPSATTTHDDLLDQEPAPYIVKSALDSTYAANNPVSCPA